MSKSIIEPVFSAPPDAKNRKLKIFLYGESGVGKTSIACQFPKPAMFDLDGGSLLYGEKYQFKVLQNNDIATIKNAIVWLASGSHDFETIVIDPITVYWEMLQKWWSDVFLARNTGYKQNKHEFYDLGPKEWSSIKSDLKGLFNRLICLNMHVIVTCRETEKLEKRGGDYIKVGTKPDCDKSSAYHFDIVLRLYREDEKFMAQNIKDRTQTLPIEAFEVNYKILSEKLGLNK